jgi:hypothetical protein
LLSGLVFPGAGHLYLRRPRRACLFLVPTLAAAIIYFGDMAQRVSSTVDKVMSGAVAPTTAAIGAQLDAQRPTSALVTAAAVVLVVCWLGSIVDSFVVGRSARGKAE